MRATNDVRFALRTLRRHPAFTTAAILASQLFGVGQHDVAVFAGVPIVLIVVAVLASWLPAARAARVRPIETLRAD